MIGIFFMELNISGEGKNGMKQKYIFFCNILKCSQKVKKIKSCCWILCLCIPLTAHICNICYSDKGVNAYPIPV